MEDKLLVESLLHTENSCSGFSGRVHLSPAKGVSETEVLARFMSNLDHAIVVGCELPDLTCTGTSDPVPTGSHGEHGL